MFDDMSLTHIKKKIRTRIVPQGNQITLGCYRYVGAFKQFEPRGLKVFHCYSFAPHATEKWSPISFKPTDGQISEQFSNTRSSLSEKTWEHLTIWRYHSKSSILRSVILKPGEFAAVVSYDLIQSENMKTVYF